MNLFRSILCLFGLFLSLNLSAARMHHAHNSDSLGKNEFSFRTGWCLSQTSAGGYHQLPQEINYGISDDVNILLGLPFILLDGIGDSFVVGDLDFVLQARIAEWQTESNLLFTSLWLTLGWRAGLSIEVGEGKNNPLTGELQTYAPFATGRSSFWFGAGLSFPILDFAVHLNLSYISETGRSGKPFEFDLKDDHLELAGMVDYDIDLTGDIFSDEFAFGLRPFYELVLRLAWDESSPMPSRLENTLGIWIRLGSLLRLITGVNLPIALESPSYLKREYFFSLSLVFR